MKYAVISSGNKQYKVSEGIEIVVDSLNSKKDSKYNFENVLLFADGEKKLIGNPILKNVIVSGKILDEVKAPKIRVAKFKAKAKYRRVSGFRAKQTKVRIEKIQLEETKK